MARNLKVSVFKRSFPPSRDYPEGSTKYEWCLAGQRVSAGLDDIQETIADIAQTLAKQGEIFISAPRPKQDSDYSELQRIDTKETNELAKHFEIAQSDIDSEIAKKDLMADD